MRLTKFGHACVRIEYDGTVVVIDPGVFTSPEAVDGADAVLITHEHPDHMHADNLRRTDAPIWSIEAVRAALPEDVAPRVHVVRPRETIDVGFEVTAVGELHAVIHPELPRVNNSGFILRVGDRKIYHPGDALTDPGEAIDLLLLPVSAPWLKASECIDFARRTGAEANLAIHDMVYSEAGLGIMDGHLDRFLSAQGQSYQRLAVGSDFSIS